MCVHVLHDVVVVVTCIFNAIEVNTCRYSQEVVVALFGSSVNDNDEIETKLLISRVNF